MPALPVRQDHHPRALLANRARNLEPIFPGIFDASIWDIERLPPAHLQNARRGFCFLLPLTLGSARPHFAAREIKNAGRVAQLRHLEESSAARLLNIIAVCSNGQNVDHSNCTARQTDLTKLRSVISFFRLE